MRVWLSCLVVAALLVPNVVQANDHRVDAGAGPAADGGGSTLVGFRQTIGIDFLEPRHTGGPWSLGAVGDVSVHFGEPGGKTVTQVIPMAGARVTVAQPAWSILPQVQFLFGKVYTNNGGVKEKDWAVAVGPSIDFVIDRHHSGNPTLHEGWTIRIQADKVFRRDREDFWRSSASLVYRFPRGIF